MIEQNDDPFITVDDVRRAGFCLSGIKTWFQGHGLDDRRLFRGELRVSEIRALNDAHGNRVCDNALLRTMG